MSLETAKKILPLKVVAALAITIPPLFAVVWIASATLDGRWVFGVDSLSRMGISENQISAALFNYGCIAAGAMGVTVGIGMAIHQDRYRRLKGVFYATGMFFLMLVGVFPMSLGAIHYLVASLFGLLCLGALICSMIANWGQGKYTEFNGVLVVVSLILVATQPFAMWEAILVIICMFWTVSQGLSLIIRHGAFRKIVEAVT